MGQPRVSVYNNQMLR